MDFLWNLQTQFFNTTHRIHNPKFPLSLALSIFIPIFSLSLSYICNDNNNNNNPFYSISSSFLDYVRKKNHAMSRSEIKMRMAGITIYRISNYSQNICGIVSDYDENRAIELYFISKQDAELYLEEDKSGYSNPESYPWHILDSPLYDIIVREGEKPPIRLIPEALQVKHAIQERKKYQDDDVGDESFSGVPVFQSDYLTMKDSRTSKKYRLAYLRKEDLEKDMTALVEPEHRDIIKVSALEDIIQEMKDSSKSESNDVLFVAPGITSWTWFCSSHRL